MATVKAVETLLASRGVKLPETRVGRRRALRELEKKEARVRSLGILDRVEARRSTLHADGFYSGFLTPEEVKEELQQVNKLLADIETLAKRGLT